jgi:5-methylcytosine-specific restriction protein B
LKPLFEDPETARAYFRAVLDESQSIEARLNFAHEEGARILKEKAPEWSTAGQDERTVSLYWAALNIAEHIPYKASFYRDYCKRAGISPAPVRRKYPHYRELMRAFIDRWVRDDEVLLELHAQAIEGEGFADPSHHLLGQTLWYTVLSQVWQREADSVPEPDFKERRYFIFQANPRIWSLEEHLRDEDVTDWSVSRLGAEMSPGDRVILWQSGERRGAYALAEITSELMPRVPESEALSDFTHGVELEVTDNWGDEPVLYSEIEGLKCFPTHLQGTNFRASAAQYFALKEWRERRAQGIGRRIWKVAPGEGSKLWAAFQAEAVAAVDWDMGDLARFEQVDQIEAGLHSDFPNERKSRHATAQTLWDFSRRILPGDFIVAKNGMQGYHGIGQVTGLQAYVPDSPVGCYQVPVDWLRTETKASTAHRLLRTFQEITDDTDQLNHLEALYGFSFNRPAAHEMKFGLTHLLADSFLGEEDVAPILTALKSKRNIILQGPPGTGKTFIAKRLAYAVMGEKDPDRVRMVQFHQSYSYEDFIQGFRPTDEGTFERRDGVFHRFCQQAAASPDAPHCFIIDEINRGNLSKIFGELMMLIEADKRGPDFALELTYSQAGEEPFHIPDNVYLIGTMNTADRSLALVDYALRRRFAFFNLTPQFNAKFRSHLDAHGVPEDVALHIIDRLNVLNEAIRADKNLGWGFEIGHSYFCKPSGEEAWYDHVIDHEVGPMLREYWFDNEEEAMRRIEALKA